MDNRVWENLEFWLLGGVVGLLVLHYYWGRPENGGGL